MAWGNGAYVLHKLIEQHLAEYRVIPYNPRLTLFPFFLSRISAGNDAELIHTAATYGAFFHQPEIPMIITFHNYVLDSWMHSYCSPLQRIHHKYIQRRLTRWALEKAKWSIDDLELIEANEAFAVQMIAVQQELGWSSDIVNVNGGAIALGHPIGASGARIVTTLVHEMKKRKAKKGHATMCIGGGMGIASCFELV